MDFLIKQHATIPVLTMKLVENNRKIKLLEMTIYIRKIELKELKANPNDPLFQEIKNIFTPKN